MKYILTIIVVFTFINLNGQELSIGESKPDRQAWKDTSTPDTIKLKILTRILKEDYIRSTPDSAFYYSKLQFDLAKKIGSKKVMVKALNYQGMLYHFKGENNVAIDYYIQSLKISEASNDSIGISSSYNNLGNICLSLKDNEKALSYYNKSLSFLKKQKNKKNISYVLNNIAGIYKDKKEYEVALSFLEESLKMKKEMGNVSSIASTINNIGEVHQSLGRLDKAYDYYKRSISLADNLKVRIIANNNIASIHRKKKEYKSSIYYSTKALEKAQKTTFIKEIEVASKNLKEIYNIQKKFKIALNMSEIYFNAHQNLNIKASRREILYKESQYIYEKQKLNDSIAKVKQNQKRIYSIKEAQNKRYFLYLTVVFLLIIVGFYIRSFVIKTKAKTNLLMQELKLYKAKVLVKLASQSTKTELVLNQEKIEKHISTSLNITDWKVLKELFNNPAISNLDLADKVSLSVSGVRSSLSKLYQLFDIKTSRNQRIGLIMKVVKLSYVEN